MDIEDKYARYVATSFTGGMEPLTVVEAEGAYILAADGRRYLDLFAGIAVVNAGHRHPEVVRRAKEQLDRYVHCHSYTYYAAPVAELAERLAGLLPWPDAKTFFATSGAEAVEAALRMAKVASGRREVVALERSFHGRTFGTLSISGSPSRKTRGGPYAAGVAFAPVPYPYRSRFGSDPELVAEKAALALEDTIRLHTSGDVAAFVAEPVLGEGGIIVPPPTYFQRVREILDRYGVLFIVDEVQTGFGRTGRLFGIEHFGVRPDIMAMAKGIADGLPLSATSAPAAIADALNPGEHLSTFGGNPVACAAGVANLEVLLAEDLPGQAATKGEHLLARLGETTAPLPVVGEVRGLGLMVGVELVHDRASRLPAPDLARRARAELRRRGILVGIGGTDGNVLRLEPPLVVPESDLLAAADELVAVLQGLPAAP